MWDFVRQLKFGLNWAMQQDSDPTMLEVQSSQLCALMNVCKPQLTEAIL